MGQAVSYLVVNAEVQLGATFKAGNLRPGRRLVFVTAEASEEG